MWFFVSRKILLTTFPTVCDCLNPEEGCVEKVVAGLDPDCGVFWASSAKRLDVLRSV